VTEFLATAEVFRTGRSARTDRASWEAAEDETADRLRSLGVVSTVASPIVVEGHLWGAMVVASVDEPLPRGTETRLENFTELVATAVANAASRDALARLVDEQAALRRVATLVARGAQPDEVCLAVSDEVGRLFGTGLAAVGRFEPDGRALDVVGAGRMHERWELADFLPATEVFRTGRSARADGPRWESAEGETAERLRSLGIVSTAASPIVVEDELWGVMTLADTDGPLPPDTEERLEKFTEIVATAIANAESRGNLQRLADEQAALRRLATLVAGGTGADGLFAAVADEAQELLGAEISAIVRFEDLWTVVTLGARGGPHTVGSRAQLEPDFVVASVRETRRAARFDTDDPAAADMPAIVRETGIRSAVATPIVVEGELWGAIVAGSRGSLPQEAEARLGDFTELVATAVANTQARQEVTALADEQAALRRLAVLVAQQPSPSEVFTAVTQAVGLLLDADLAVLHVFPGDGTATMIAGWSGDGGVPPIGTRVPLDGDNLAARIFESGAPARIDSYAEVGEGEATDLARSLRLRSSVGAPILVEGKLWGALMAATRGVEPWAENAETRIAAFTELVATAIANAEARAEVERLADEQAALRRVATLVARGTPPEDIFAAAVDEVAGLLPVASATMGRFEPDDTVTTVASWSAGEVAFPTRRRWPTKGKNVAWMVLQTRRSARIDDFSDATDPIGVAAREAGYKSAVGSPIVVEGDLWGVMTATSSEGPLPPGTEARLASFTELVATAVANTQARQEVTVLADEQAALRQVATLVAQGASHAQVFSAIARQIGELLGLDVIRVVRYEDDAAVVVAGSGMAEDVFRVGSRTPLAVDGAASRVSRTGEPVRIDDYETASATMTQTVRSAGIRGVVATPIWVEGRLWGAMTAGTTQNEPLPPDTETRLGQFTELMATAIANAESKSELAASRRRIVAASDETRRRIERDLHDGTQQRLVSLGLAARAAQANLPPDRDDLRDELSRVAMGLADAVEDLQEISRGIHPAILSKGGLGPALQGLAHRSAIPVKLDIRTDTELPEPVEVAAYYVASEALANAAKHAQASQIEISLANRSGSLVVSIRDDGVGGTDARRGSGLVGLNDRVEALGGSLRVASRAGGGTKITAELPLDFDQANAEAERPGVGV
jgi:GAF domain-containing protein